MRQVILNGLLIGVLNLTLIALLGAAVSVPLSLVLTYLHATLGDFPAITPAEAFCLFFTFSVLFKPLSTVGFGIAPPSNEK